jgi:predicted RNA-binding Zn-ribbon protein involved in translation (DUF1610 family)
MTYSESLSRIKRNVNPKFWNAEDIEHYNNIVNAIEKQIPKKPRLLSYGLLIDSGWRHECPNCKCAIGKNEYLEFAYGEYLEPYEDYCPQCGQAIDWSDIE